MLETYTILKIVFIFVFFFLTLFSGILPAKNAKCKDNQTVLGIANSFAAGVFLAISLMHIMPEAVENFNILHKKDTERVFPLPYLIFFFGYTFILVIDRVLFDSHALFDDDEHHGNADPAEQRLIETAKKSILATQQAIGAHPYDKASIMKSMAVQQDTIREGMRAYLSKTEKFSVRMSRAMKGS
jgi:zinc transporter ZupT